jgi:bacterioferritin (cytochrome b1)
MTTETALLDLLRCELNAANHQFTHILALQKWGMDEEAARITEVDNVDFANSMKIIDYLIQNGMSVSPARAEFNPGTDYASILRGEQATETRLVAAIERSADIDASARHLVDTASAPRAAYAQWLTCRIESCSTESDSVNATATALQYLVAHLITMIEQSMIHAFIEWHGNNKHAADAAWATSGAAMMHLTRLVRLFATLPSAPTGGTCPQSNICYQPGETLHADRDFALLCVQQADTAAQRCDHPAIAKYCSSIAGSYREFASWRPENVHPAATTNPPVFHSFAATRAKFIE